MCAEIWRFLFETFETINFKFQQLVKQLWFYRSCDSFYIYPGTFSSPLSQVWIQAGLSYWRHLQAETGPQEFAKISFSLLFKILAHYHSGGVGAVETQIEPQTTLVDREDNSFGDVQQTVTGLSRCGFELDLDWADPLWLFRVEHENAEEIFIQERNISKTLIRSSWLLAIDEAPLKLHRI